MSSRALRAATIALFATGASVAAPASVRAQDLECDPDRPEVRELLFRGNRALKDGDLALRVRTTPSALFRRSLRLPMGAQRCLDRTALRRDVVGLRAYYEQRGYYLATVDTLVQPVDPAVVRVVFTIDEGPPTILESYQVTGLAGVADSAAIINSRQLRVGRPFDQNFYLADLDSIVRRLRNAGYYRADLAKAHEVKKDSLIARVTIDVLPGLRARFGEPQVDITAVPGRGIQLSKENVLRVMGISPGDRYSDRAIVEGQRSLFQLGTYQHIEVAPLPDSLQPSDSVVILQVLLTEDFMRRLDSEYGWATLDCGRVRLQYTDLNFARTARRLELTAQASKIGYGLPLASDFTRDLCTLQGRSPLAGDSAFSSQLHYFGGIAIRQPRLLGTQWVPTLSVYSERRGEYKAYLRETNVGVDFSATRDLASRTQLRLGYSREYGRTDAPDAVLCALFSRCDDASRVRIKGRATLGVASATVVRSRTDNLVNPTRGSVMRAEARSSASPLLGTSSELYFNKGSADIGWYVPFGGRNVATVRFRSGAVFGRRLSDTLNFVPPQERLYAGGPTSVRGFQPNELGDVVYIARLGDVKRDTNVVGTDSTYRYSVPDTAGFERVVPLGGSNLFVANFEYRLRDPFFLPDLVQYTFFVDAGDVWNKGNPVIKWTPGIGVRVLTPVGPIQMNLGFNPSKRAAGPIYFEDPTLAASPISPLYCVSPGNAIVLTKTAGVIQPPPLSDCPTSYRPREPGQWYRRLTFTFSIGPDF